MAINKAIRSMGNKQTKTAGNEAGCEDKVATVEFRRNEQEVVKKSIFNHHFGSLRGHWKQVAFLLVCYDVIVVNMSYFLVLWLRFDCQFNLII